MTVKFRPVCEKDFRAGMLCWCGGDLCHGRSGIGIAMDSAASVR
jgi:hypothetical protein